MSPDAYPKSPADNPFELSLAEIQRQPFLFLGAAIEWIICHDQASRSTVIAEGWDAAERELFDFLDAGTVDVQGYRAPGHPRVHESLPQGIWARMNKDGWDDPKFSPIDDSEEREDGGSVHVGDLRWDGVRLPTSVVLKHWPPTGLSGAQPKASRKRSQHQERVRPVLEFLYPDGIPDKSAVSDGQLYNLVAKHMGDAARADTRLEGPPSRETILRAAGRM